jgi:hypothetical protein
VHVGFDAGVGDLFEGESGFAEAGDGVGGLGPELGLVCDSAGSTAYEPQGASGNGPDGEHHLPLHASTLAARDRSRPVRCRSMRRLAGALIGVLLALGACGVPPANEPTPTSSSLEAAPGESTASPTPSTTTATPGEVPEEQQFSLDDVAEFDDGLLIEIAGSVADKAKKSDRGAEATDGEIVIASVRIENETKEPYDAANVLIGATYGNGTDAQIIVDETDELQSGFTGTIKPNKEDIATVGFAVPFTELKTVTFIVDPNDDVHEAISFTGTVQRD